MTSDRRTRVLECLYGVGEGAVEADRLGRVCAEVTAVTGAGLMLMSGDFPRGSVATTDAVSTLIEDLQFELGEGPCVDAYRTDRPVFEPDLADPATPRWIGFTSPAVAAGARAVFGFPLQVGSVRLGAMNLYCDEPTDLSEDQHANALVVADVAAQALLIMQSHAAPGAVAAELEAGSNFQHVVHQASGMVAAQLDVNVAQALIRLRGHAFGHSQPLAEVAADVVARRLRFHPGADGATTADG
ncbi:MAG TPA: GAF and ANTAR domain-containing protein [Acidimicrobiales bacterium]|nr:GAF and ANTAR domain-containing protein [Acidimicrobiales bacterium]